MAIRPLMLTGSRRVEMLGLRWENVDFEDGELCLSESKTGAFFLPGPVGSMQGHAVPN